jgi:hypothetical protein
MSVKQIIFTPTGQYKQSMGKMYYAESILFINIKENLCLST